MRVKFVKPFAHYEPGQEIDPPGGQAELMIQRGWCVAVDESKAEEKHTKPQKLAK